MTHETEIKENAAQMNMLARQSLFPLEVEAAFSNRPLLKRLHEEKRTQDMFLNPKAYQAPVMIIGSGPSLDEAGPYLKDWKSEVMCSTSQARTLLYYGKVPDFIVAYDVRTRWDELSGINWKKYPSAGLCVHPGMATEIIERWAETGNPLYTYRQRLSGDQFREEVLTLAYPFIRSSVMMGGCTLTTQLSMMRNMGYNVGFLVGVDFGNSRFTEYKLGADKNGEKWIAHPAPVPDAAKAVETVTGMQSDSMQVFYKRQMFVIQRMDRSVLISCSTPGKSCINELPWAPIKAVIERQGQGFERLYPSAAVIERICDVYLAQAGKYCVEVQGQPMWLEKVDPRVAIPELLANVAKQGARIGSVDRIMAYWESVLHESETGEGPLQAVRAQWAEAAKELAGKAI